MGLFLSKMSAQVGMHLNASLGSALNVDTSPPALPLDVMANVQRHADPKTFAKLLSVSKELRELPTSQDLRARINELGPLTSDLTVSSKEAMCTYYCSRVRTLEMTHANIRRGHGAITLSHKAAIGSVAFSDDGRYFVSADFDGIVKVWDLQQKATPWTQLARQPKSECRAIISANGRYVGTQTLRGSVKIWDMHEKKTAPIELNLQTLDLSICFSLSGHWLLTTHRQLATVWDLTTNPPSSISLSGHTDQVLCGAFANDEQRVVTASANGLAKVWDFTKSVPTAVDLLGHQDEILCASFFDDGRQVVTASKQGAVKLWDLHKEPPTSVDLIQGTGSFEAATFYGAGRYLVLRSAFRGIDAWDLQRTPPTHKSIYGFQHFFASASLSADGRFVAMLFGTNEVKIWPAPQFSAA